MLFRLLILLILLKKLSITQKLPELKKKKKKRMLDNGCGKYITTQEFNKLLANNFEARLVQEHLTTKADITDFVKEADFDNKLKSVNKKVTSEKIKHVLVENELDEPTENVELVSTKGLTKKLIKDIAFLKFLKGAT